MDQINKEVKTQQVKAPKRQKLVKSIILHMKIQKMVKLWRKKAKKSRQRVNILKQWVKTEEDYIKDLNIIINMIQKPMLQSNLITAQQDRILFPNLHAMLKLSGQMLIAVKSFLQNWNPHKTMIGDSIINFHKYFIIYREYCNNFYKAQKIMKQVKKRKQCQSITKQLPMDIQSYIIKPVQRPPKYQLLLRQYKKAISPQHKDFQALSKAIQKYHDVNQQNNQSMDLQIRNQKMIHLDKKYGGIINTTRVYLFEETGKSFDMKVKIYVFNDLILVVRVYGEDKEEGYKKIFLDGQSFVDSPMDGKYLINRIFVCGTKQNLHINFLSENTKNKVFQQLKKIIHELYRKQTSRAAMRKKTKTKMNVMNIQQIAVKNRPSLRITVVGAEKRPNLLLNLNYETIYIIKVQAAFPGNIFQYSSMKFDQLTAMQKQIKSKNKMLALPLLDDKPDDMNIYDVKKNKTKIIQYRQTYIQRFINFVFRSEQLQQYNDLVINTLKINEDLWKFASYIQPCTCQICLQQKQNLSFQQFEQQKQQIKFFVGSSINLRNRNSVVSYSRSSLGDGLDSSSSICVFNSFMMPKKILQTPASQLNTLQRRLTWLQCKQGRIDYTLIAKDQVQKNIKITIQLLSLKQDQVINVRISRNCTVLQVLDEIAGIYKIQTLRDFGLVLQHQNVPRILDRDQKLYQVLKQIQYPMQQLQKIKQQDKSLWNKFNSLKKWGQQMITGKKTKLYLKKCIFVSSQLQIIACEENPQRYSLIVEQVFYRFKNQLMILGSNETKRLCALFYVLNYMDKLAHLNQANFQVQKLKNVLPEAKWHLISSSQQFQKSVYICIKEYEGMMQNSPLPTIRRSSSNSTIFSKVQVIYGLILNVAYKTITWSTMFFEVTNYDPPTLPGSCSNLLLGINKKHLIIIRHKQLEPLLQIQLNKLDYKITVMSIFIETEQKTLRFDGQMMFDVRKIIETYQILSQKFGDS